MEERTSGIILRTRPLTETSLIVQWLTPEQGRLSTVAKGARRPKSAFSGKLDLFYEAEFSYVRSRRSELHTLREVVLVDSHAALRQDLGRLRGAAYAAVLFEQGTERETPLPEFYRLFRELLESLGRNKVRPAVVLGFELQFLELIGVTPALEEELPPQLARLGRELGAARLSDLTSVDLPSDAVSRVSNLLRRCIGMALERLPSQRESLFQYLAVP